MEYKKSVLLKEALQSFIKEQKLARPMMERRALEVYPVVVGEFINRYTSDVSIKKGVMTLHITSPALRQELLSAREALCRNINKAVGASVVQSIVIR